MPDRLRSIDGVKAVERKDDSLGLRVTLDERSKNVFDASLRKIGQIIEDDDVGRDATVLIGSIEFDIDDHTFLKHRESQWLAAIMPALYHETTVEEARVDLGTGVRVVLDQLSVPAIRSVTAGLTELKDSQKPPEKISLTDGDHHFLVQARDLRAAVAELDRLEGFLSSRGGKLCRGETTANGELKSVDILLPDHDGTAGPTRVFHDMFGPQPTVNLVETAQACSSD